MLLAMPFLLKRDLLAKVGFKQEGKDIKAESAGPVAEPVTGAHNGLELSSVVSEATTSASSPFHQWVFPLPLLHLTLTMDSANPSGVSLSFLSALAH